MQTVVTSPPYWGLRDYGEAGQLGLEETPEEYVSKLVEVFREVRRVLRPDGTLWLNLGDCYATGAGKVGDHPGGGAQGARWRGDVDRPRDDKREYREEAKAHAGKHGYKFTEQQEDQRPRGPRTQPNRMPIAGLKPKDLVGIPWRVAFALQADGWWLRQDVIWNKPNPMPESVTDRPTKSHEYLFLLTPSRRYYYDAEAVKEPGTERPSGNTKRVLGRERGNNGSGAARGASIPYTPTGTGRNRRSVWTVATQPYPGAHFATFPEKLIEPCVLAGTSSAGRCPECGAPWARHTETPKLPRVREDVQRSDRDGGLTNEQGWERSGMTHREVAEWKADNPAQTVGWGPTCAHGHDPVPCIVLDPFCGSGTTVLVANRHRRLGMGVDLSARYLHENARARTSHVQQEML